MDKSNDVVINDFWSLYDQQFTIKDFKEKLIEKENESGEVIDSTKKCIKKALEDRDPKYVVNFTDEQKNKLKDGAVKLDRGKNGEVYAQLRENGQYSEKLSITEDLETSGISYDMIQAALQMQAIKEQLNNVVDVLNGIDKKLNYIGQELKNDRVGLFYSGLNLYGEALKVSDTNLSKHLIAQSLKSLSDANSQLIQEIRTSINYLRNKKYSKEKNPKNKIDNQLALIQQAYELVFKSSLLKAMIYSDCNEYGAMVLAFDEYKRFVNKMIVPNIGFLSECEKDTMYIDKSSWNKIAETLESCDELTHALENNELYLISMGD